MNEYGVPERQCRQCQHARPHVGVASLFGLLPSKWDFATCGRTMRAEGFRPGGLPHEIPIYRHPSCVLERAIDFASCGPVGRFFEARSR
jgi:hypothetical protein